MLSCAKLKLRCVLRLAHKVTSRERSEHSQERLTPFAPKPISHRFKHR